MADDQVGDPIEAKCGWMGNIPVIQVLIDGRKAGQGAQIDQGKAQSLALLPQNVRIVAQRGADAVGRVPCLANRNVGNAVGQLAAKDGSHKDQLDLRIDPT